MAGQFIPPVQPIGQAPQTIQVGGRPQPKPQPGQGEPEAKDQGNEQLMILVGAVIEALIGKGVLDEEDIHNAISQLSGGGAPQEKTPEGGKKGGGYPGAADTDKGQGGEPGKMDKASQ